MKQEEIIIKYKSYKLDDLSREYKDLIKEAEKIRDKAYAVYSGFYVGVSIQLENNKIYLGNNQENIALPSSLCAERVAIFYCKANNPNSKIKRIAIAAKSVKEAYNEVVTPCGACRQVISEYERNQSVPIEIILKGEKEVLIFNSIKDLLPLSFDTSVIQK